MAVVSRQESNYIVNAKFKDTLTKASQKAFKKFEAVAGKALKAAVAGAAALAAGFTAMAVSILRDSDRIQKLSIRLGVATEALSELKLVAELSGIEFNQLALGMQRMTRRIAEAAQGMGEAQGALRELNFNAFELAALRPEQQFEVIADALAGVTSQSDRVRLAFKLFDSEGVSVLQTMQNGAAGIREMREEAKRLGLSLSGEQASRIAEFNDQVTLLKAGIRGIVQEIALDNLSPLQDFIKTLSEPEFRQGVKSIATLLLGFVKFLVVNSKKIVAATAGLTAAFIAIKIGTIVGAKGTIALLAGVVAALVGAGAAWAAMSEEQEKALKTQKMWEESTFTFLPNLERQIDGFRELSKQTALWKDKSGEIFRTDLIPGGGTGVRMFQAVRMSAGQGDAIEEIPKAVEMIRKEFFNLKTGDIPALEERHDSFTDSAIMGLESYARTAGTVSDAITFAFDNMFQGLEDGLTEFIKNGELNFSNFIDNLITDLIRFQVRQMVTLPFANFLGGFFGSFKGVQGTSPEALSFGGLNSSLINSGGTPNISGLNFRAGGGPVRGGRSFVVGERGREIFTPESDGRIVPNHELGTSVEVNVINNTSSQVETKEHKKAGGGMRVDVVIGEVVSKDIRNGGPISKQMQKTFSLRKRTITR